MQPEPKHGCTKNCLFSGRVCRATKNTHRCTQRCVVLDSEENYICTFTGIIMPGSTPLEPMLFMAKKTPQRSGPHAKRIHKWAAEAVRAFLVHSSRRQTLVEAAQRRVAHKMKTEMPELPWSARQLAAITHKVTARATMASSLSDGADENDAGPFVGWLTSALIVYYTAFAKGAFKPTRSGIGTFVAVMISCMRVGMQDAGGIYIVVQNTIVANHCPSPLDFPRLAPGMVTCKAMSSGRFAMRTLALTNSGHTRKSALFRPAGETAVLEAYAVSRTLGRKGP